MRMLNPILIVIGLGIGLIGALTLTRFLASATYEVNSADPFTFAGIALILTVVALAACYIPARPDTREPHGGAQI